MLADEQVIIVLFTIIFCRVEEYDPALVVIFIISVLICCGSGRDIIKYPHCGKPVDVSGKHRPARQTAQQ